MRILLKRAPKGGHKVCVETEDGDGFVVDKGSVSIDPAIGAPSQNGIDGGTSIAQFVDNLDGGPA